MKKIKVFLTASALSIALIAAIATKASTKLVTYYYYVPQTGEFIEQQSATAPCSGALTQCFLPGTTYPLYATESFASPYKHN